MSNIIDELRESLAGRKATTLFVGSDLWERIDAEAQKQKSMLYYVPPSSPSFCGFPVVIDTIHPERFELL